jgi:putative DNA primase/helicase
MGRIKEMTTNAKEESQSGTMPLSAVSASMPRELANNGNSKRIGVEYPQGSSRIACENATVVDASPFRGSIAETTHEEVLEMPDSILSPEDCLIYGKGGIIRLDIPKAADMMMRQYAFAHIIETGTTYIYHEERGGFVPNADIIIDRELYNKFRPYYIADGTPVLNRSKLGEIVSRIHAATATSINAFRQMSPLFNLRNGVLDLETFELMPHSPEHMMLEQSLVDYDPCLDCPQFRSYLDDALDAQYHDTLAEIFGYSLWTEYNAEKAFMFYGPPRTGKGTLLRVLQEMLGSGNYSSVNLQDLVNDRFKRAELFGKRANISGDVPATPIKDPAIIKNLTGEDNVTVEFKYGKNFQMINAAKLIFGANRLPRLSTDDDAFYDRWVIIPVEHSFIGDEDPSIEAALKTPEELSGILNWALGGLQRLRANGWHFSTHIDGSTMYRRQSKPEIAFLEEMCEASADGYIVKTMLISEYNAWARANRFPPAASMNAFGRAISDQAIIPVTGYYRPWIDGKQREAWTGIRFKDKATA